MELEEIIQEKTESEIEVGSCPDCGAPGHGEYCHQCGEKIEPHLFSVGHYIKEVFQEFISFDTKFFRTVPPLLFKPGFLSSEYISGRRKRYLAPARLYMVIAFFSFFALGNYLRNDLNFSMEVSKKNLNFSFQPGQKTVVAESAEKRQKVETMLGFMIEVSPYVLLLGSTPAFALILKLLYWKRKRLYGEHLVFSFHFFAFALLVLIAPIFTKNIYPIGAGYLLFLVYLYFALRKFYKDRGILLVLRTLAGTTSYFTIAAFALALTMLIAYEIAVLLGELPKGGLSS